MDKRRRSPATPAGWAWPPDFARTANPAAPRIPGGVDTHGGQALAGQGLRQSAQSGRGGRTAGGRRPLHEIRDLRRSRFRGQRLVKLLAVAFAKLGAMRLTAELGSGSV
jgi:hypothetical protein